MDYIWDMYTFKVLGILHISYLFFRSLWQGFQVSGQENPCEFVEPNVNALPFAAEDGRFKPARILKKEDYAYLKERLFAENNVFSG